MLIIDSCATNFISDKWQLATFSGWNWSSSQYLLVVGLVECLVTTVFTQPVWVNLWKFSDCLKLSSFVIRKCRIPLQTANCSFTWVRSTNQCLCGGACLFATRAPAQNSCAVSGSSLSADLAVTSCHSLFMKLGQAVHPCQYSEDIMLDVLVNEHANCDVNKSP